MILALLAAGVFAARKYTSGNKLKERGNIEIKDQQVDDDMYAELSSNVYKGTVNYQPLFFVFMKYLGEVDDRYECLVFYDTEDQLEAYESLSRYDAVINKDGMTLTYIDGSIESTFECRFLNGELYVNNTKLNKADLKDCPIQEI